MNEMLKFRDKVESLIYFSNVIRQIGLHDEDAMYFLKLEIDDLEEQYKKVNEKLETMI